MTTGSYQNFERHVRPLLTKYLRAAGLDVEYHRAQGNTLYRYRDNANEVAVLDYVGGFGAGLLGHNHPVVKAKAIELLANDRPVHAQGSIRGSSGLLGQRLAGLAHKATGLEYVVTFANSGTEAVEAALKHAEMERGRKVDAIVSGIISRTHQLRRRLRDNTVTIAPQLLAEGAAIVGVAELSGVDDLLFRLYARTTDSLDRPPRFIALRRAFHGKSSGSLTLTHRPEYRAPWRHLGPQSSFAPANDLAAMEQMVAENTVSYHDLELCSNGTAQLVQRSFCNIAAVFIEPIQGEGGVRELNADYVRGLRRLADDAGFPLVIDEIQAGMGRTGKFFASEHSGVAGDYYLLSKALGAGLAKISAVLVNRSRYIDDFGFVHTSTFAEDDFSSELALTAINLLTADDDALMKRCARQGDKLLAKLTELQREFPEQITDVRGRGLMIGVELASTEKSASSMLRVLSEQDLLGFVVSGFLLHEQNIRVAPTLSSRATLRLEPSAYLSDADIDRLIAALRVLVGALAASEANHLMRYLVGDAGNSQPHRREPRLPILAAAPPGAARVAFLSHFLNPGDLLDWDPMLGPMTREQCEQFFVRTRDVLEPFVVSQAVLNSILGTSVHASIIAIPFVPTQVVESMRLGEGQWATDLVHRGVELARQLGASVVGFGGYTSIVTNNCRTVVPSDIALTSGNSLTAAAALEAANLAANRLGLVRRVLGVVGAVGNIGQVFAELAADQVDQLVLVGRAHGHKRLQRAAASVYGALYQRAKQHRDCRLGQSLRDCGLFDKVSAPLDRSDLVLVGEQLFELSLVLGNDAAIRIADGLGCLRDCNMVLSATNSAKPVVTAEHIGTHPTVICDVAVPVDVDRAIVKQRPNAVLLRGGMVNTPMSQTIEVPGMVLAPGELYGCMAETLIMGLAGVGHSLSYGSLDPIQVRRAGELARMHGFTVEENPVTPSD